MKYQAIIVDNETNMRKALELLLEANCPDIDICGSAASAQEARGLLKSRDVDLIFLDISMPGEDGFTFLRTIPCENYGIIFITAYHGFCLLAIKASAIDYLLKPIDATMLKEAVARAVHYHQLRKQQAEYLKIYRESLLNLLQVLQSDKQLITHITVPDQHGFKIVMLKDLIYLQADGNYTILHLSGQNTLVAGQPLNEFEMTLANREFFRIHKSTLINLDYLKLYAVYAGDSAMLSDGTLLTISRRRLDEFRKATQPYLHQPSDHRK